jgi:uncharacterized protein with PQ loop repeat
MHNSIEIIYLLSSSIAVLAMIPQVKRLLITKQSDELSLGTWATWGCCQLISLLYAFSLRIEAYIIVGIAWMTFYVVMVSLIIKYRKNRNIIKMGLGLLERRKAAGSLW